MALSFLRVGPGEREFPLPGGGIDHNKHAAVRETGERAVIFLLAFARYSFLLYRIGGESTRPSLTRTVPL
ncbi:MAG: hypothetical protein DBX51_07020 [Clostridiales bacterium]|nr:MAG: hypothetical protein DBX51_07020 [Clostridiales bacterium]